MQDSVGSALYANLSEEQLRKLFIQQMSTFAQTISDAENPDSLIGFIAPYLSMAGLDPIISRLNAATIHDGLIEAAEQAEKDSEASGVIFGYLIGNNFSMLAFSFKDGSISRKEVEVELSSHDSVAEDLFFELLLNQKLIDAAEALNMSPLLNLTAALCAHIYLE